jgi:hypothetical protein
MQSLASMKMPVDCRLERTRETHKLTLDLEKLQAMEMVHK